MNEAWLRLVNVNNVDWQDRAQFFGISSRIMPRVRVETARARLAQRRDGGLRVTFDERLAPVPRILSSSQLTRR